MAMEGRYVEEIDGEGCHMSDYQGSLDDVNGVPEAFAFGEGAQVKHQNRDFNKTDGEEVA